MAAQIPLGKVVVTTAGTPEKATKNGFPSPPGGGAPLGSTAEGLRCQSMQFQALPTNGGLIYIGDSTMNVSTGVGIHCFLTAAGERQSFSVPMAANALHAEQFYLDAAVSGEGVYVSLLQQ